MVMSRRNSLPPLSEMTAVQVPPTVQCVWSRRAAELLLISAMSEIIPPSPPCFALRLRRAAGFGGRQSAYLRKRREGRGRDAGAGRLGRPFSGCKLSAGVRGCARLRLAD